MSGSVISDTFRGVNDIERQRRIWNALKKEYGEDSREIVGVLLAYTKAEWHVPLEGDPPHLKKQRKAK